MGTGCSISIDRLNNPNDKDAREIGFDRSRTSGFSTGGQPATLALTTVAGKSGENWGEKIQVNLKTGKNLDGTSPDLDPIIFTSTSLSEQDFDDNAGLSSSESLKWLKVENVLFNFGCEESLVSKYTNKNTIVHSNEKIQNSLSVGGWQYFIGKTILICNLGHIATEPNIFFYGQTVVLANFRFESITRKNKNDFFRFGIKTSILELISTSELIDESLPSMINLYSRQTFELRFKEIYGDGILKISSTGVSAI